MIFPTYFIFESYKSTESLSIYSIDFPGENDPNQHYVKVMPVYFFADIEAFFGFTGKAVTSLGAVTDQDNFDFELEKWQKVLIWAVLIAGTIITYTSLYIMWSPVGNSVVLGLNGKYFIPLMLPLCLIFKKSIAQYDYDKVKFAIIIAVILILASSEMSLLHRFYNITPQLYYKI